jgi:hypothetical protein
VFFALVQLKTSIMTIFRHMEIRISTLPLYVVITLAAGEIRKVSDRIVCSHFTKLSGGALRVIEA